MKKGTVVQNFLTRRLNDAVKDVLCFLHFLLKMAEEFKDYGSTAEENMDMEVDENDSIKFATAEEGMEMEMDENDNIKLALRKETTRSTWFMIS